MSTDIVWRKLRYPIPWNPSPGDELVGYFKGGVKRSGSFGEYTALLIGVPVAVGVLDTYMVSGYRAIQAVTSSDVQPGAALRVAYAGKEALPGKDYEVRLLEVFVAEAGTDLFALLP